jgi:hypothetical protein
MRQLSLEINELHSNRLRVQIIPQLYNMKIYSKPKDWFVLVFYLTSTATQKSMKLRVLKATFPTLLPNCMCNLCILLQERCQYF